MYNSLEDFNAKIDWEGSYEAAIEYGLNYEDLPEDEVEARKLWLDMQEAFEVYACLRDEFDGKFGVEPR